MRGSVYQGTTLVVPFGREKSASPRRGRKKMTKLWIAVLVVLASLPAFAGQPESLDALKARAAAAPQKEQVELFTRIAEYQLQVADAAYSDGNVQQAEAALHDIADYGVKAAHASAQTGKRMKPTEIALRKISNRLEVIRKALNVDDRPAVASALEQLEQARTELLNRMFRK